MPEVLTESFCERCGTRYTFEAAAPRGKRFGALKVLSKGLVNFVANDETSLDEAFADARNEHQRAQTTDQLDAFHKTFQFCMSCRQYTCGNCWNEVEGRCLSCAPHLGHELLGAPFETSDTAAPVILDSALGTLNGHAHGDVARASGLASLAWPTADLPTSDEATPGPSHVPELPPTALHGAAPVAEVVDTPSTDVSNETPPAGASATVFDGAVDPSDGMVGPGAEHDGHPAAAVAHGDARSGPDPTTTARARTSELFARLRPRRQPRPDDVPRATPAAAEDVVIDVGAVVPPEQAQAPVETIAAAAQEALPETAPDSAADSAADLAPATATDAPPPSPPASPLPQETRTPIWSMVAPESLASDATAADAGKIPATAAWNDPAAAPRWPVRSVVAPPSRPGPDLWVASSQDVLNRPGSGVQACVSCGLPLSASARFCRRCGSQQQQLQ